MSMSTTGRRIMWRIGRRIYSRARGEVANHITTNGETYIQSCVDNATRNSNNGMLVIFDVGANLGEWTRLMLGKIPKDRLSSTRIYLFEPIPDTRDKLIKNISAHEGSEVTEVHPLAMSNSVGSSEMLIMSETGGTNSLEYDDLLASKAIKKVTIEKSTLDRFCKEHGIHHIHLLKCDAEGHDSHVLSGAKRLLQNSQIDVAQFEYNQLWIYSRSYLKDVFDLIDGLPYRLGRVCPGHVELFDSWHFELERFFEGNYVLIREPVLEWFEIRYGCFDNSNTYA